jgi:hypothetical protein
MKGTKHHVEANHSVKAADEEANKTFLALWRRRGRWGEVGGGGRVRGKKGERE